MATIDEHRHEDERRQKNDAQTALVNRAISGDPAAFEELYVQKAQSILFHAYGILKSHHDAEDAAQEVVLRMYRDIGKLRAPEAFNSWMHRIVINVCYTLAAKRSGRKEDFDEDETVGEIAEEHIDYLPQEYLVREELFNELKAVIEGLPAKRRSAITMHYFDNMSYKEIAEAMDSTISTVSTNIVRGKIQIKEAMEQIMEQENSNMKAMGAAGTVTFSGVFGTIANQEFPRASVDSFTNRCAEAIKISCSQHIIKTPKSPSVLKITAIIAVSVIAVSGLIFGPQALNAPLSAETASQTEASPALGEKGLIEFVSDSSKGAHVNPAAASVTELDFEADFGEWEIAKKSSGEIVSSGEGMAVASPLTDIATAEGAGEYILYFGLYDENRQLVTTLSREFRVEQ
ncbi:MAG: RNA polymerase sigma factor [Clostridiales Family XIII bacterium]|nr:RNA polymerase sigma factor [Clostridiales Family XIII bacterium]